MAVYSGCKVKFTGTINSTWSTATATEVDNSGEYTVASNAVQVDTAGYYNIHGTWGVATEYSNNQGIRVRRKPSGGSFGEIYARDISSANGPGADMHFPFAVPQIWLAADDSIDFQFNSQTSTTHATDHGESVAWVELAIGLPDATGVGESWGFIPI